MASWKIAREDLADDNTEYVTFAQARKYFAVDASGSTGGSVLRAEEAFAKSLHQASEGTGQSNSMVAKWGTHCDDPRKNWETMRWISDAGGTRPSQILMNEASLGAIRTTDVLILITDGEVWAEEVEKLARLGLREGIFSCPTVFVITSAAIRSSPGTVDISVGMTSYANCTDALCLFKDYQTKEIFVMASKGCFAELDQRKDVEMPEWVDLTSFKSESELLEKLAQLQVKIPTFETRADAQKGLDLGDVVVDLEKLLSAGKVSGDELKLLLADKPFDVLSLACKSRGEMAGLRKFLSDQKVEIVAVQLEDVAGAAAIISQLGKEGLTDSDKTDLQAKLRAAHAANRENYITGKRSDAAGDAARERNRFIDGALRTVADVEKAGFTADILSRRSNRAKRAGVVSGEVDSAALDFDAPAFKGECAICCGDDEIMSISLKVLTADDAAANTSPANVNVLSSQCICFSCAMFGRPGFSTYNEPLAAVIPTLQYTGTNRMYINEQLYIALTGGLKTGVPHLVQLFATILDCTLRTKVWAGAEDLAAKETVVDSEAKQRQAAISWLIKTILTELRCRENFNETGQFTVYPKALAWAAKQFRSDGLTSWAITYPVSGFQQILRFGKLLAADSFTDETVRDMKATKLLHSFASAYLSKLLVNGADRSWTQSLLALVYAEFNAELVPRYTTDAATILRSVDAFWDMLAQFLGKDGELLDGWTSESKERAMPRVQILAFWLIYFQPAHTSAKTYFLQLKEKEPLSVSVLDPTAPLPAAVVDEVLLSPFLRKATYFNKQTAEVHMCEVIPFENPFGASVLHCGFKGCGASFIPSGMESGGDWTPQLLDKLRQNRAKHMIDAYGIADRLDKSQTGLPEPTAMPIGPSSIHSTLHMSTARVWAQLPIDERRAVATGVADKLEGDAVAKFVHATRIEICEKSHRGNVYSAEVDEDIIAVLPSFMKALEDALVFEGKDGKDVALYTHDFTKNKMEWKATYEIAVKGRLAV